jgi:hypothetical protein
MKKLALLGLTALAPLNAIHALTIDFEDLATRESFTALGISESYLGFGWGYGLAPGVADRTFVPHDQLGWGVATSEFPCCSGPPLGLEGSSYGWSWNAPQSLWIDFRGVVDVAGLAVAQGFPVANPGTVFDPFNSNTLQLFGYDALDNLVASSAVATLTGTFQPLVANFSGITFLEIRSDRRGSWFSVDSIVVNPASTPVPVPGPDAIYLLAVGALGLLTRLRSRRN